MSSYQGLSADTENRPSRARIPTVQAEWPWDSYVSGLGLGCHKEDMWSGCPVVSGVYAELPAHQVSSLVSMTVIEHPDPCNFKQERVYWFIVEDQAGLELFPGTWIYGEGT